MLYRGIAPDFVPGHISPIAPHPSASIRHNGRSRLPAPTARAQSHSRRGP